MKGRVEKVPVSLENTQISRNGMLLETHIVKVFWVRPLKKMKCMVLDTRGKVPFVIERQRTWLDSVLVSSDYNLRQYQKDSVRCC